MTSPYTNSQMQAVLSALECWDMEPEQVASLAADLPGEFRAIAGRSQVGPDDFCRACHGGGCPCCDYRGHEVSTRRDTPWPKRGHRESAQ